MEENSTVVDLLNKFCDILELDSSETRLMLNGERLEGKSQLKMLKLEERTHFTIKVKKPLLSKF